MEPLRQIISIEVKNELKRRQEKNRRYSLRAYAKQLQVEPSLLSKIIREKVTPTSKTLEKLVSSFSIDSVKKTNLLSNFSEKKKLNSLKYQAGKTEFVKIKSDENWPFASWDDLVVFSTLGLSDRMTLAELNQKLDIDGGNVKKILDRLILEGLVDSDQNCYSLRIKQVADDVPLIPNQVKKNIQKKVSFESN